MSCQQTILDYGLRSLGYGERLLPKSDFTLCQHFTLIGSGLIWNIYFGALALLIGFFIANAMALAKASPRAMLRRPAEWFILIFRGSPLFIQFFLAYFIFLRLKQQGLLPWLTAAQFGALLVLILNTAAYSAEIFYGALRSVPNGEVEAADAYGLTGWSRFRRVIWPPACAWLGRPIPMRQSFCFMRRPWYSSQAFQPGNNAAMPSITPAISQIRRSTHSSPIPSWPFTSSCSLW